MVNGGVRSLVRRRSATSAEVIVDVKVPFVEAVLCMNYGVRFISCIIDIVGAVKSVKTWDVAEDVEDVQAIGKEPSKLTLETSKLTLPPDWCEVGTMIAAS